MEDEAFDLYNKF